MPVTITPVNLEELVGLLDTAARKQIPFATSLGLNNLAKLVKQRELDEMQSVFDKPTPWTMKSLYIRPSTKRDHQAVVWFKEFGGKGIAAADYLPWEVYGGNRVQKRYESALTQRGLMNPDERAVPGQGAKIDQYGNITGGQVTQMLSQLRALSEMGYDANARQGTKTRYFVARGTSHLRRGVYKRNGRELKPIIIFTKPQHYTEKFDFFGVANSTVSMHYNDEMVKALDYALKTAKP